MQPIPRSEYATGRDVLALSGVNVSDAHAQANIRANLALGLQEVEPHPPSGEECMLLAGGPSLNACEAQIRAMREGGMPMVTTNGAYNWVLERGMRPGAQVVLDARAFNARFVQPVLEDCVYLLASQCDPALVASTPRERTWLWHCGEASVTEVMRDYFADKGKRDWYPVHGSMTVMLRAIPLLIMLGWRRYHIFGWDSCLLDGAHHAYAQPENSIGLVFDVHCTGDARIFHCTSDLLSQAQQFIDIQPLIAPWCEMCVYGDGLIAHIINTGAAMAEKGN